MKHILIILILSTIGTLHGQVTPTSPAADTMATDTIVPTQKIQVDEVEVIKAFEVTLGEAKRIAVVPIVEKPTPRSNTYDYEVTILPADITYPDPIIKPLAMSPDAKKVADRFYAKLGYGMLNQPYADVSYHTVKPEVYTLGIDAHHHGQDNTANVPNQKYHETSLGILTDVLAGENLMVTAGINGLLEQRNLYSTNVIEIFPLGDVDRQRITAGLLLGVKNIEPTTQGLDYSVQFSTDYTDLSRLTAQFDNTAAELDLNLNAKVSKKLGDHSSLYLTTESYYNSASIAESTAGYYTVVANPGIRFQKGRLRVHAAADLIVDNEAFRPFADGEVAVSVTDGLEVYVGADQQLLRNNIGSTLDRNPFAHYDTTAIQNTISRQFFGGVRGRVLNMLNFDVSAGLDDVSNQYFYTSNNLVEPALLIDYLDMTAIGIDANLEFTPTEHTTVGGTLSWNNFNPAEDDQILFNIPSFTYETYVKVGLFGNKLQVKGLLELADRVQYISAEGPIVAGNTLSDLSLEVNYFITDKIAVWVRGNNLLDNEYIRFGGHPTVGINALGGVIFKF